MIKINGITSSPSQTITISDPNGSGSISFNLNFRPRTQNWYADIAFKAVTINGLCLVRGPNILYRYSNILPFGMGVSVSDNYEPFLINDFSSGRVSLILLTSGEVAAVQALLLGGAVVP